VWDYHVVLVLRPAPGEDDTEGGRNIRAASWIYDFDTTLDLPYDAEREYLIHRILPFTGDPHPGRAVPPSNGFHLSQSLICQRLIYIYPPFSPRSIRPFEFTSTDYLKQTFPYLSDPSGLDAEYHR